MNNQKFTDEAIEEIKTFYVYIRNVHEEKENMKPLLICVRELAMLKKYAQEFSEKRNSEIVTKEDAINSIEKLKKELTERGILNNEIEIRKI